MKRAIACGAAAVAASAGLAVAQPVVDGILSANEAALFGDLRFVQTRPTNFGDNNASSTPFGGGGAGNPLESTTGVEFRIAKSALGNPSSFDLAGWINSGDRTFLSNQIIGSLPLDTPNLGGVGSPARSFANEAAFPGNQFVTVSNIPTGTPTVDGTLDASIYGAPFFVQGNFTGFGNSTAGTEVGGGGSEIGAVYVAQDANNFYFMVTGNLEANGNALDLYFDSVSGGAQTLASSGGSPDVTGGQTGHTFDAGFEADFFVSIDSTSVDSGNVDPVTGNAIFVQVPRAFFGVVNSSQTLLGTAGGFGASGAATVGDQVTITFATDNSNVGGVTGSVSVTSPSAPNANFAYGSEIDNVRARVDAAAGKLYVFIGGNIESNFNRVVLWLDTNSGGQQAVLNTNVDILFNGLNRHGPDPAVTDGPGLVFDNGFDADYWIAFDNGLNGSNNLINFANAAVIRTDGALFDEFSGAIIDYGSFFGGEVSTFTGAAVANPFELLGFSGPQLDPQEGLASSLFSQFAPRTSGEALLIDNINPAPFAELEQLQVSINNSNVGGVTSGEADFDAAAGVLTGFEIVLDLDEIGWDGVQDILLTGWVANNGLNVVSASQFLAQDPIPFDFDGSDENTDPEVDASGNFGEVRNINLAEIPGLQFINLTSGVVVPPDMGPLGCNPADLSDTPPGSGTFEQLDGNDISAFVAGFIGQDPISDISDTPPGSGTFGQFDGNDISAFVASFLAGCP